MIQDYIISQAKVALEKEEKRLQGLDKKESISFKDITHTVDYYFADDNTITVYSNAGQAPDLYDNEYREPSYQIWIRSSDWDKAKVWAEIIFKEFHKKSGFYVYTDLESDDWEDRKSDAEKAYYVFLIAAASDPLRIGVNDKVMEYSINLNVTMTDYENLKND